MPRARVCETTVSVVATACTPASAVPVRTHVCAGGRGWGPRGK